MKEKKKEENIIWEKIQYILQNKLLCHLHSGVEFKS